MSFQWITGTGGYEDSPLLRRSFFLEEKPAQAKLSLSMLGYGVASINGKPVTDDVLTTPLTRFDVKTLYRSYDVADLLQEGENVIGVMLGNGWYNDIASTWDYHKAPWRDRPKLWLSLEIAGVSGKKTVISSDAEWKTSDGPVLWNHVRGGEYYDARREKEGFDRPGFDDADWDRAIVARGPGGRMEEAHHTPIRVRRTIPMKEIGPYIYDAGVNMSGWVRVCAEGEPGSEIRIIYSERLRYGCNVDNENINAFNREFLLRHEDRVIIGNEGKVCFSPHFCFHGFRYAMVTGPARILSVEAREVNTATEAVGRFWCSDDMLNEIHEACVRSIRSNWHDIPEDCPHREQNGWTGDAQIACETALMNLDIAGMYEKWMDDILEAQLPGGMIPCIIPGGSWGYFNMSGPAWDAALPLIPLWLYDYRGRTEALEKAWPGMCRYMDFLESMQTGRILDFGLGDWCPPAKTKACPRNYTDTMYYYLDAKAMAKGARLLGKDDSPWEELAGEVRAGFRDKFIRDGLPDPLGQTALACFLASGLAEPEEEERAAETLASLIEENDWHIDCGILGTKFIFRALADRGYDEVLYRMVSGTEYPGYGFWIASGMTTLAEDWEMGNSLNHQMFCEVDLWFYRYVAGIRLDDGEVSFAPHFLEELTFAGAEWYDYSIRWNEKEVVIHSPKPCRLTLPGKGVIELPAGRSCVER